MVTLYLGGLACQDKQHTLHTYSCLSGSMLPHLGVAANNKPTSKPILATHVLKCTTADSFISEINSETGGYLGTLMLSLSSAKLR